MTTKRERREVRRKYIKNAGKTVSLKKTPKEIKEEKYTPPMYPTLYLSDVKLPVDEKSVGKTMKILITAKLTDYGESTTTKGENSRYTFEIQDMKF
jgi:hypothetical protein